MKYSRTGLVELVAVCGLAFVAGSAMGVDSAADQQLAKKVQTALHADPYFYDKHVDVSVEDGNVVLRGFVSSEWDLRQAIKIATQAAGGTRVIDNLTIKQGGRQ